MFTRTQPTTRKHIAPSSPPLLAATFYAPLRRAWATIPCRPVRAAYRRRINRCCPTGARCSVNIAQTAEKVTPGANPNATRLAYPLDRKSWVARNRVDRS